MPTTPARVRRCTSLYIERRNRWVFDPVRMLQGEDGLIAHEECIGLNPQHGVEVVLTSVEILALDHVGQNVWNAADKLAQAIGEDCVRSLLAKGVLVLEGTAACARDEQIRDSNWHSLTSTAHVFSRWSGTDSVAAQREARLHSVEEMVRACGPPPPHFYHRADAQSRALLPRPPRNDLDDLMARRATCRNFDTSAVLAQSDVGALLHRAFGVQGSEELAPGAVALKKNHPSGGGLHPLEAYLVVQRVEDLQPGVYHYNVESHALDLLRAMPVRDVHALSLTAVAGQTYFAEAPVMLVIAARFARSFWKYRNHPKIYRAIVLEAGHASQNVYLAATDMGMGAYVTAAINEVEIEQAFGLDPLVEGPLAVCGFGRRTSQKTTVELDPLGMVWNAAGHGL
ncbi:MAG: putative peptide maturation dehydrogenase [Dokdonella sp.]